MSNKKGRNFDFQEIRPEVYHDGKWRAPEDFEFMRSQCTKILLRLKLLRQIPDAEGGGLVDTHGQPFTFPTHRGDKDTGAPLQQNACALCVLRPLAES